MQKKNTKAQIRETALTLFSERGYDGVGMRDIAGVVGIRESAIYKHYSSKQELYESIFAEVELRYESAMADYMLPHAIAETLTGDSDLDSLIDMCARMFHFYLIDEWGARMRRLTTIEQFRPSKAGGVFRDAIIGKGLDIVTAVFAGLMEKGLCIKADPAIVALQFYSPLYFLMSKYDGLPAAHDKATGDLVGHIALFTGRYLIGGTHT